MSEPTTGERIAVLEAQIRFMRDDQTRVLEKLEAISVAINSNPPCPEPGACLNLSKEMGVIRAKVDVLEADRNQRKGERGIIAVLCTLLGTGLTLFINWLTSK